MTLESHLYVSLKILIFSVLCRFSPLWSPASGALGALLTHHRAVAWPLVLQQLQAGQHELLAGQQKVNSGQTLTKTTAGGLEGRWEEKREAASVAASGGCTDAGNRCSWLIKAVAAVAEHNVQQQLAKEWVPLLLQCAGARQLMEGEEVGREEGGGAGEEEEGEQQQQQQQQATEAGLDNSPLPAAAGGGGGGGDVSGKKRKQQQQQQEVVAAAGDVEEEEVIEPSAKRLAVAAGQSGLQRAVAPCKSPAVATAHGSSKPQRAVAIGGGKAWRSVMTAWLEMLGGIKGVKGLPQLQELQQAVAAQLLSADGVLQGAAIKCLKPFKLPYLPVGVIDKLVRLSDVKTLREELLGFPLGPGAEAQGGMMEEQRPGGQGGGEEEGGAKGGYGGMETGG